MMNDYEPGWVLCSYCGEDLYGWKGITWQERQDLEDVERKSLGCKMRRLQYDLEMLTSQLSEEYSEMGRFLVERFDELNSKLSNRRDDVLRRAGLIDD